MTKKTTANIGYPSAAVVFGVHLSAQSAFRFEPPFAARQEIARNPPLCEAS